MKKKKLSELDLISIIGERNIRGAVIKTLPLTSGIDEHVLLCLPSGPSMGYHSGIISMMKVSYDISEIGIFSIHTEASGFKVSSTNTKFKFYSVKKGGIEYVAIRKTNTAMGGSVQVLSMHQNISFFEVAKVSDLTDITLIV